MGVHCCSKHPASEDAAATFDAFSRRGFMLGLVATTGATLLVGCSVNPNTGEEQFIVVSEQQLDEMSQQSWQQIKADQPVLDDPQTQQRVQRVGRRVVDAANLNESTWEFVVFRNDQVNAFALPGGQVGIFTGILDLMRNDAQLATVIGHEIGHVAARHSAARVSRSMATDLGMQAAAKALSGGNVAGSQALLGLLGAGVTYGVVLPYSREQELEADALGIEYMAKAGYDPAEAVDFWQRMAEAGGNRQPEFTSTHPAPNTRIRQLRELVGEWRPVYQRRA